jgi:hypothetical protein
MEAQNLASAAAVGTRTEGEGESVVKDEEGGADGEVQCCDDRQDNELGAAPHSYETAQPALRFRCPALAIPVGGTTAGRSGCSRPGSRLAG